MFVQGQKSQNEWENNSGCDEHVYFDVSAVYAAIFKKNYSTSERKETNLTPTRDINQSWGERESQFDTEGKGKR